MVKKRGIQSQQTIGELSNFLAETVAGNKIVKSYNMEEYEIKKFNQLNQKHFKINSKIAMVYSLSAPVIDNHRRICGLCSLFCGHPSYYGRYHGPRQICSLFYGHSYHVQPD